MFDSIVIIDKSITTTPIVFPSPDRPRAFFPIISPYGFGRDDQIKLFQANTQATFANVYGTPNPSTTGLPSYYAYEFLRGGGDVYTRRITASDSSFANSVIIAKFREGTGASAGKAQVLFQLKSLSTSVDLADMYEDAQSLRTTTPDANGYIDFPIAIANLTWTGANGNNYTWRLMPNRSLDRQLAVKAYTAQVLNPLAASPLNVEFTMSENIIVDSVSVYANDVFETQSPNFEYRVLPGYKEFVTAISAFLPEAELVKPDIFFGVAKDNTPYPNYEIDADSIDFTVSGGMPLSNGSDGKFGLSNPTREDDMMARYVESFDEDETKQLFNEYKFYIDYVFDFASPQTVKDALVSFADGRKSTTAIIDTGITNKTVTSLVNMRKNGSLTYNSQNVTIVGGIANYIDPWTNRKMVMPLSFFEAFTIPNHIITMEGGARPFAGNNYTYDNMVVGSYQPMIYDENGDEAQSLIDNEINIAFEDLTGYTALVQETTVKADSVLGERNNVHLLHLMIRSCLLEAKAERWNFAEDSDIEKYKQRIEQRLMMENDGKLSKVEIEGARAGQYGQDRNRVNIGVYVEFKSINKGTTFRYTVS